REQLGDARTVWIAISTHEGEYEQLLAAHRTLLQTLPEAILILVPRHPQRFDQVAQLVTAQSFTLSRRTEKALTTDTQVYLGDTMGEIPMMLAAAAIAFVGGSLIERGGHNLLEPAALGKPILTGPSTFNFSDITQQLIKANGAVVVNDAEQVAQQLQQLLSTPEQANKMGHQALVVVKENQ